jgi:hypothetical protein
MDVLCFFVRLGRCGPLRFLATQAPWLLAVAIGWMMLLLLLLLGFLLLLYHHGQRQTPHWLAEFVTLVFFTLVQVHQPPVLLLHVVDHRVDSMIDVTQFVRRCCWKVATGLIGRRQEETTASSGLADGLFARRGTVVLLLHVVDHRVDSIIDVTRVVRRCCWKVATGLVGRRQEDTTASSGLADGLFARRCTVVGPARAHDDNVPFFCRGCKKSEGSDLGIVSKRYGGRLESTCCIFDRVNRSCRMSNRGRRAGTICCP